MKKIIFSAAVGLLLSLFTNAQNLAVNTDGSSADVNAILDVKSNNKGILIPRMNTAARLAIPPTKGLLVYDETTQSFWYNTGTQWNSIATSTALAAANAWLLTGNSGTDSSNFLGTLDNVPLNFRVNNTPSGRIDHISGNTYLGFETGMFNTTAHSNTVVGNKALRNNTIGVANTATGFLSMFNSSEGNSNTAIAEPTLYANFTGSENTAVGSQAMHDNQTGHRNVGTCHLALYKNTTGSLNAAYGASSMYNNQTGSNN